MLRADALGRPRGTGWRGRWEGELGAGEKKDICTPMSTAALVTIAKTWKPSKCPPTDAWIKKMWYLYSM